MMFPLVMARGAPRFLAVGFVLLAGALGSGATPATAGETTILLQRLDKVTARVFPVESRIGQVVPFGTLEILPHACVKSAPEEPPESAAFLEIREIREGEPPKLLFKGWMFASSPALSALEHSVYDVWVVDCKNASKSSKATSRKK